MDFIFENFGHFLNPNWIMQHGGLYLVLLILFIETGIFIGFFLPGDPLLFVAGMVIASADNVSYPFNNHLFNLLFWMLLFALATILGYYTGYWIGRKFGPTLKNRKDGWLFKKKYIEDAHRFYEKRGGFAIGISRFLPIVRSFVPLIGGMVNMDYKKFSFYNVLGAILWGGSITTLGYILGDNIWVQNNLEYVIIGLVLFVTAPVLSKMLFKKRQIA